METVNTTPTKKDNPVSTNENTVSTEQVVTTRTTKTANTLVQETYATEQKLAAQVRAQSEHAFVFLFAPCACMRKHMTVHYVNASVCALTLHNHVVCIDICITIGVNI